VLLNSVYYGASAVHIQPLQNVLNAAARLVVRKGKYDSITTDLRDVLHWLAVQQRTEYKVSLLIYMCLHQAAPLYLTEMCVPVSATQRRHGLRQQYTEIWRSHDVIWQDTDKGAATSLDHHCGTLCH